MPSPVGVAIVWEKYASPDDDRLRQAFEAKYGDLESHMEKYFERAFIEGALGHPAERETITAQLSEAQQRVTELEDVNAKLVEENEQLKESLYDRPPVERDDVTELVQWVLDLFTSLGDQPLDVDDSQAKIAAENLHKALRRTDT